MAETILEWSASFAEDGAEGQEVPTPEELCCMTDMEGKTVTVIAKETVRLAALRVCGKITADIVVGLVALVDVTAFVEGGCDSGKSEGQGCFKPVPEFREDGVKTISAGNRFQ